jgi:hypothetical protein
VAIVVILAAAAHGREMSGKIGITPQWGLIIPIDDDGNHRDIGFKHGLELEYFITNNVSLGLLLFRDVFPAGADLLRTHFGFRNDDDNWPIYGLAAQAKFSCVATSYTDVFGRLGFALARAEFYIDRPWGLEWWPETVKETETFPELEVGFGISRHLSPRFAFYTEIEYSLLFTKGVRVEKEPIDDWYSYTYAYNIQMAAIKMGLTFYLGGR